MTKLQNIENLLIKITAFFNNKLLFDYRLAQNYHFRLFFINFRNLNVK